MMEAHILLGRLLWWNLQLVVPDTLKFVAQFGMLTSHLIEFVLMSFASAITHLSLSRVAVS